jgi:2-dehydro-3-deoxyphosphogluconate aldolase/(4S)-4-hydroxy-2-oxoglutarate aldolase
MLETLRASRLLAIIRLRQTHHPDTLLTALDALAAGGIRLAEITIDTPNALTALQHYQQRHQREMQVGVGTVTQTRQVARVRSSHASFIVTPVYVPSIITTAKEAGLGVLCGALTPTEIFSAYAAGADAVKVFPASSMGASYFKQVAAPLPDIPLLAVGGVSVDNALDYLAAGAIAVAAGSALVSDRLIAQHAWEELTARAKHFVDRVSVQSDTVQSDKETST